MARFDSKVVLVTGGGGAIGSAAVHRFVSDGARVAVVDVDESKAARTVESLPIQGSAIAIRADVTDLRACQQMVDHVVREFGRLDVVFANAGVSRPSLVADTKPEEWGEVIAVNLGGVFLTCKVSIPALVKAGGGSIVTMSSSMAGWDSSPGGAAYMASKEGVSGLTKSLALQLGRQGIRVNAVCPGVIRTRLNFYPGTSEAEWEAKYDEFAKRIPLGRVGEPEDVAGVVAFLASDDARHVSGSMVLIDGGQTLQSWSNAPRAGEFPKAGMW